MELNSAPGVHRYERGIPQIFQAEPSIDSSGAIFHAIAISYTVVKQGKDQLQRNATEFGMLLPAWIDPSEFAVELFLHENSVVHASLNDLGQARLKNPEMEKVKEFTKWMFDLVLGRNKETRESEYRAGPKNYYVVPLVEDWQQGGDFSAITDWYTMDFAVNSGLYYMDCAINQAPETHTPIESDTLVALHSDGRPYLVISAGGDRSCIVACKLYRAISYLMKHGNEVPKRMRQYETFVSEECTFDNVLRGKLYRGALRLPSVLYELERFLLAAELRDKMGVSVSTLKVMEALTSRACHMKVSYEALELLGDSVLKVTGATHVYYTLASSDHEGLGVELYKLVCNKTLSGLAHARHLSHYISAEIFSPAKWLPPGMIPVAQEYPRQILSNKTLADVVEALLGACILEGGFSLVWKALDWFQINVTSFDSWSKERHLSSQIGGRGIFMGRDLEELQEKLNYKFKNEQLLVSAFTFEDSFTFKRLEFLGDAVLDFVITRHLVTSFPRLSAGDLNNLKQATVNMEHYSCICVRHGFHDYIQKVCCSADITTFAESLSSESTACTPFGISAQTSPKLLGDVMQTLAASIFIDSGYDLELVWQVYKSLLKPIATPESVMLQPVAQLQMLCRKQSLTLNINSSVLLNGYTQADVIINGIIASSCQHEEKRVARRLASMQALQQLLKAEKTCNQE